MLQPARFAHRSRISAWITSCGLMSCIPRKRRTRQSRTSSLMWLRGPRSMLLTGKNCEAQDRIHGRVYQKTPEIINSISILRRIQTLTPHTILRSQTLTCPIPIYPFSTPRFAIVHQLYRYFELMKITPTKIYSLYRVQYLILNQGGVSASMLGLSLPDPDSRHLVRGWRHGGVVALLLVLPV